MSSILIKTVHPSTGNVITSRPVQCRWKGTNLAVHSKMVYRADIESIGPATKNSYHKLKWTITHIHSGFAAAVFLHLSDAVKMAKLFDSLFTFTTKEEGQSMKELGEMFNQEIAKNGGIPR